MGVISTVKDALLASKSAPAESSGPKGAYWCHDCSERLLPTDADADPPACPSCGQAMAFERSPDSGGCAC
ncbi:hypothetical protein ACFQH6_20070 [Halobacteriaceae archaeon GCM10025711]